MVTRGVVVMPPSCICNDTADPDGAPAGTTTLIWFTPTNWGESPENCTCACTPPINTVGVVVLVRSVSSELLPVTAGGVTARRPVPKIARMSPGIAGCVATPEIEPLGWARDPS